MASPGALRALLESGCALVVASVGADLAPHASRGWGLDVLEENRVRLLVDADDAQLRANLNASRAIAITATNVPTLRSTQMKGRAVDLAPASDTYASRMARYCDEFFADVEATDGIPRSLMERLVPAALAAYYVDVDAVFDQTPGPGAGAPLRP